MGELLILRYCGSYTCDIRVEKIVPGIINDTSGEYPRVELKK